MRASRFLRAPTYFVAFLLALLPMIDLVVTVWPLQFGNMRWRVAAMGQLSSSLTTVLVAFLFTFAASVLFDQPRVQRAIVALAGLMAATLLAVLTLFVLDVVQLRGAVRPELRRAFDVVALQALVKLILSLVTSILFAVSAFRASRIDSAARRRGPAEGPAMVVGARAGRSEARSGS